MMTEQLMTPNMALPLLATGQAQKEVTHNEALVLVDALLLGIVEQVSENAPPSSPSTGAMWIIGPTPSGAWTGAAGKIAVATAGGWRFVAAPQGAVFRLRSGGLIRRTATGWATAAAVSAPTGGTVIDSEARAAISAIKELLAAAGWQAD